jgi:hypothetical protein
MRGRGGGPMHAGCAVARPVQANPDSCCCSHARLWPQAGPVEAGPRMPAAVAALTLPLYTLNRDLGDLQTGHLKLPGAFAKSPS